MLEHDKFSVHEYQTPEMQIRRSDGQMLAGYVELTGQATFHPGKVSSLEGGIEGVLGVCGFLSCI